MCDLIYVHHTYMCPLRPENVGYPRTGITSVCEPHTVVTENPAHALLKSNNHEAISSAPRGNVNLAT